MTPASIEQRLESVRGCMDNAPAVYHACHPGLLMNKLLPGVPCEQAAAGAKANQITGARGDGGYFVELLRRHQDRLTSLGGCHWKQKTLSPMALHLSHASLLENANVCLHHSYGFAYLPGSGLKGMARSWAETVWLPQQTTSPESKAQALRLINRLFGWGDTPSHRRLMTENPAAIVYDAKGRKRIADHVGSVIFHDAWPSEWPRLEVDVLTPHHSGYYSSDDEVPPPGDWENPVPVNFLTIAAGTSFEFAISPMPGVPNSADDVDLARRFLLGALSHMGAGAKTNAGYGFFNPTNDSAAGLVVDGTHRQRQEFAVQLVTPAFLAGARQDASDCELRGATLRGQLRWWWRTMHAAHLGPADLRRLENLLWGSAQQGGAIGLSLVPDAKTIQTGLFNREAVSPSNQARNAELAYRQAAYPEDRHPNMPARVRDIRKLTPGLHHTTYGMDETRQGQRHQRHVMAHGAQWKLTLTTRPVTVGAGVQLTAQDVMQQATAALRLLAHFGGVGSKARKGWGALRLQGAQDANPVDVIAECTTLAAGLRGALNWPAGGRCQTPALEDAIVGIWQTPWKNPIHTLQQVGFSLQLYAASNAHLDKKQALGLPRRRGRDDGSFQLSRFLLQIQATRHASPWHVAIAPGPGGALQVRYIAFPSAVLPNRDTSGSVLTEHCTHLKDDLLKRIQHGRGQEPQLGLGFPPRKNPPAGAAVPPPRQAAAASSPAPWDQKLLTGDLQPRYFNKGNKYYTAADKVAALVGELRQHEGDPLHADCIAKYAKELKVQDKDRWREVQKNAALKPLYDYLREQIAKGAGG